MTPDRNSITPRNLFLTPRNSEAMHEYTAKVIIRHTEPRRDGTCALSLQCFIGGKKKIVPTGLRIEAKYYDRDKQTVKLPLSRKKEQYDMNMMIEQARSRANTIFIQWRLGSKPLTPEIFERLYNQAELKLDFIQFAEKFILSQVGTLEKATLKNDRDGIKNFKAFSEVVTFGELCEQLAVDFDNYLKRRNLAQNTRWKHNKVVNKCINAALRAEVIRECTFSRFKIKKQQVEKTFCTAAELNALINLYANNLFDGKIGATLEAFIFAATSGGFRHSDCKVLTRENIIGETIVFNPFKTRNIKAKLISLNLTDVAKKIIEGRYGKLFPLFPDLTEANENLKLLAIAAKINKPLSTHVARHTFATQYLENKGRVEVLQKILGHTNIQDTMVYVHLINDSVRSSMHVMNVFQIPNSSGSSSG